jgi:serine acetyltransferase
MIRKKRLPIGHLALYGWLPSPLKVWAYRVFRGYRIGKGVKLAFGAVVVGENVELADHVEIGLLAMVMGRTITIGRHSSVGTMSYVACERIQIGEDARIREQVFVGGPQLPESSFTLGNRTIILQLASINPTKPVTIGDDTGIGGHCLIFTHGAWLNALDGYPVTYEHYVVEVRGSARSYRPAAGGGPLRLFWRRTPDDALAVERGDTVFTEVALDDAEKTRLRANGVYWLDLAGRSRSAEGSPLTEELATFIARYGIRLPRDG